VPLGGGAATGQQQHRIIGVGHLGHWPRFVEIKPRALIGGEELSVGEEPAFTLLRSVSAG
jgi:hypothetical protein